MKKQSKNLWKYWWVIPAGLLVIIVGLFVFFWLATSIPGDTKPILTEADKLKVEPSWKLESERVVPPYLVNFGDVASPSVTRTWKLPGEMSEEEFKQLIRNSGWDESAISCKGFSPGMDDNAEQTICDYWQQNDGIFNVSVVLSGTRNEERYKIWLYVDKI
ncbi:hypothetical protein FWF48_02995 [Candidatus Saccharibacteria bacterium]|nr:hypothetical protein [Candidatus Saccharibacteria bacterium]